MGPVAPAAVTELERRTPLLSSTKGWAGSPRRADPASQTHRPWKKYGFALPSSSLFHILPPPPPPPPSFPPSPPPPPPIPPPPPVTSVIADSVIIEPRNYAKTLFLSAKLKTRTKIRGTGNSFEFPRIILNFLDFLCFDLFLFVVTFSIS